MDRGDGIAPRAGVHREHREVPAAQQPRADAGRGRDLHAVPGTTTRDYPPAGDRDAGPAVAEVHDGRPEIDDGPVARAMARVARYQVDADVSPRLRSAAVH